MRVMHAALIAMLASSATVQAQEKNIYFILDASGSMWGELHGSTKIEIAKDLLMDRLPRWGENQINIGLVAYGHNRRGDCGDIETVVDLQPMNEPLMSRAIAGISPKGKTPIAGSVALVTDKLRASEESAHVVLISDGEETCHEDPCAAVSALKELGVDFTLDVIGFDITEAERSQLECIAAAGDGRYFSVDTAGELDLATETAVNVAPIVKVAQNIQIIIDRSGGMNARFAGQTKLSVVLRHLREKLEGPAADVENLALRSFGGSCGDIANTVLDVPFATGNGRVVADRVQRLTLVGDATLSSALKASLRDFSDPARFDGVARRVVLFTGSRGDCDPSELYEVNDLFRNAGIRPEVHLIAVDPPPDHIADLERMAGAVGAYFYPIRTEDELAKVMDRIFDILPVMSSVETITNVLNGVVGYLNDGIRNIERKNYDSASGKINDGRKLLFETRAQFVDLGQRQTRDSFNQIYRLASDNRKLQEEGFKTTEALLDAHRAQDVARWNSLIGRWNQSIGSYNSNIRRLDSLLSSLR